ncbi:hypothetical protein G9A89_009808 [Geosiphon pyriformis]|nr:hypothetical protein G9A89_009808 [Geosiphon pyriformis]
MLQNDSEKTYIIEPNKKIVQAIFLPLVKIAQLVSVGNRKELEITARGIQSFKFMSRIDVPVNMAEEEIIDKKEIISTYIIEIPEEIIIEYLTTKIKDQLPNTISDFPQLCEYVDITSQTIYRQEEYYLLQPKQLKQMNLGNLDSLQCI